MTIKPSNGVIFLNTTQTYNSISGVGSDLLSLDIYYRNNIAVSKPVVIYIHGGAWALGDKATVDSKSTFFTNLGYVFVSVNYRLSPAGNLIRTIGNFVGSDGTTATASTRVKHSTHVSDCATAVTWVYNNISSYGGNPNKLILIGHSAGAHLVSLLATNQSYLTTAGLPSGKVIGCISLDTEGYDVYKEITQPVSGGQFNSAKVQTSYQNAFGIYPDSIGGTQSVLTTDFATTTAAQTSYTTASPISNINGSTPPFLVFRRGPSDRITRETEFVTALQNAGRTVTAVSYPDDTTYTHAEINQSIGATNDPPIGKSLPSGISNVTTQIQNWITNLASPPANAAGAPASLSFTDIQNEFGLPPGKNLGAYRLNGGITVSGLESLALDNEVNSSGIITALMPKSGTIKFSDFYGKKLNVVVDYTVATGYATRKDYSTARGKYNAGKVTILGFALKDEAPDNTKVWIHTNGDIGSDQPASKISTTYCSLLTGKWSTTTDLRLDIGTSGGIYGAGGNGGAGGNTSGNSSTNGIKGGTGSSALGIQHTPIIIINHGSIVAGGGGGGGGGAGNQVVHKKSGLGIGDNANKYYFSAAGGGGGGGGRGLPGGGGGGGGTVAKPGDRMDGSTLTKGKDGSEGTKLAGGKGGNSSSAQNNGSSASGGAGGGGANDGKHGDGGGTDGTLDKGGSGSDGSNSHKSIGGLSGYSIIFLNDGTGVTIKGNSEIGNTITNTTPK